jgi:IS30 family transposase
MILCELNQNKKLAKVFSGKNAQNKKKNNAQSTSKQNTEDEALKKAIMEVLEEVIKRLPTIAQGCDAQTLDKMFEILSSRPDFAKDIEKHLSPLKTSTLKKLFDLGILNPNIVDINLLNK